jgi:hypothetical protein
MLRGVMRVALRRGFSPFVSLTALAALSLGSFACSSEGTAGDGEASGTGGSSGAMSAASASAGGSSATTGATASASSGSGGAAASAGVGGTAGTVGAVGSGGVATASGSGGSSGAGSGAGGSGGGSGAHAEDAAFCASELESAVQQYAGFLAEYDASLDQDMVPRSASNGNPRLVSVSDWTSGFPAGTFWYLYEHTMAPAWRTAAERWTAALEGQRLRTDTHDVGFVINNSYGNGFRLTQNAAYVGVLVDAAESLSTRFNTSVGATRSWDWGSWSFPVIIDNMMNIELLFRAASFDSDTSTDFRGIAIAHATTTSTDHFRDDASSYHLVDYNPSTGAVVGKQTEQGIADESAWARGQTWGLYGFVATYRDSADAAFLARALAIADFYTQSPEMPDSGVPYFDFDVLERADVPDYPDTSAAAIASSALLELAEFAPLDAAERYRTFAINTLRSLSSAEFRAALGTNAHFLLTHGVGNYPDNEEVDVALNYADYYYVEALLRCSRLQ